MKYCAFALAIFVELAAVALMIALILSSFGVIIVVPR